MKVIMIMIMFISFPAFTHEKSTTTLNIENEINLFDKLKEWDLKLKTLKAKFTQEVFFKVADMKQKVEGEIYFKKPDNLKIVHTRPQPQVIIINSKKEIFIVKPNDKQIIKSLWDKWKNNLEPKLKGLFEFGNYSSLERNSKIENIDKNTLKITPLNSEYSLVLKLDDNFFPFECELDLKDTIIKTKITDIEINKEIKKEEFEYKNKDSFDVLKL